ncbi:MAG: hypothetical protein AB8B53_01735 [Flavobacteriales bacterium]
MEKGLVLLALQRGYATENTYLYRVRETVVNTAVFHVKMNKILRHR